MQAGSQASADDDLVALHREASSAARTRIVNDIVPSNGGGAQSMNTLKPRGAPLPEDGIATVVDREGRVIARTRDLQRFAGQPAAQDVRDLMLPQREGVADRVSLEETPVVGAFGPGRAAGWTIAVVAPGAHLHRPALAQALVVLATVAITGLLAWRMTRTRP